MENGRSIVFRQGRKENNKMSRKEKIILLIVLTLFFALWPWVSMLLIYLTLNKPYFSFISDVSLFICNIVYWSNLFWWLIPFGLLTIIFKLYRKQSDKIISSLLIFSLVSALLFLIGRSWWALFDLFKNPPP